MYKYILAYKYDICVSVLALLYWRQDESLCNFEISKMLLFLHRFPWKSEVRI